MAVKYCGWSQALLWLRLFRIMGADSALLAAIEARLIWLLCTNKQQSQRVKEKSFRIFLNLRELQRCNKHQWSRKFSKKNQLIQQDDSGLDMPLSWSYHLLLRCEPFVVWKIWKKEWIRGFQEFLKKVAWGIERTHVCFLGNGFLILKWWYMTLAQQSTNTLRRQMRTMWASAWQALLDFSLPLLPPTVQTPY